MTSLEGSGPETVAVVCGWISTKGMPSWKVIAVKSVWPVIHWLKGCSLGDSLALEVLL